MPLAKRLPGVLGYFSTRSPSPKPYGSARLVDRSATINGAKVNLTAKQYVDLQKYVGTQTKEQFGLLAASEDFQKLSDEEKVKKLSSILTDIGKLGKIEVLGDSGDAEKIKLSLQVKNDPEYNSRIKSIYDKVQSFDTNGNGLRSKAEKANAQAYINSLSDEEYEAYKTFKAIQSTTKAQNTSTVRNLLGTDPKKAVEYVRNLDSAESKRIIDLLTDEEYALYQQGK